MFQGMEEKNKTKSGLNDKENVSGAIRSLCEGNFRVGRWSVLTMPTELLPFCSAIHDETTPFLLKTGAGLYLWLTGMVISSK